MKDEITVPIGIRLISYFYIFGAAILIVCMFTNYSEVANHMVVRHGFPVEWKLVVLPAIAALAIAIAYGLHSLSRWGYYLTFVYLLYFGTVSFFLAGRKGTQPFLGNFIWSVFVILYLLWKRRLFFLSKVTE
ncbi:MAG TPA: hypothetical protein ENN38_02080 [Actinobacteria bacterium]|nr:hypothetical protein [Actinomycetota bacterium]